jgi:hypothetical protein
MLVLGLHWHWHAAGETAAVVVGTCWAEVVGMRMEEVVCMRLIEVAGIERTDTARPEVGTLRARDGLSSLASGRVLRAYGYSKKIILVAFSFISLLE